MLALSMWLSPAFAADTSQSLLVLPCAQSTAACIPSKTDLKTAKAAFSKALRLEKNEHLEEAYAEFDTAARLVPRNMDYLTALAMTRQQLVFENVRRGNAALQKGQAVEAQGAFRQALDLDPENKFAQQRLLDSLGEWAPRTTAVLREAQDGGQLHADPRPDLQTFHFRGDSRTLLTQVAGAFGLTVEMDDSVASRRVHFDIGDADFYAAMTAAGAVTGTFWTPLSEKQVFIARDSPENHRLYDRMALRTFYLSGPSNAQEFTQAVSLLRTIFEIRFLQQQVQSGAIVARAPVPILDAAAKFLEGFDRARPQVMLDIQVFQINHQLTRNIGVHIPYNFNLFNIPAAALTALGGQNIQDLINQLISSGGINQADSQGISALIAQLQGQQGAGGVFSQPLATFGGGLTLMGLSLDNLAAQLSLNESWVRLLDHATFRTAQGNDATFRLGSRFPVVNASFAPIFNTSAISQVLQNGSFQAPIPSFSYEDLGLDLKAKPVIATGATIGLELEVRLRTLAGQSLNGVPIIANREYKGSINLVDGEPAIVASAVTHNEQLSLNGLPGLASIPGLNRLATTRNNTDEDDELLVVITPHTVNYEPSQNTEVWLPR